VGLGGVGKTQAAVQYAYGHKHLYSHVLWLPSKSEDVALSRLFEIARILKLSEHSLEKVDDLLTAFRRWLGENGSWLLIFDNAEDCELIRKITPESGTGQILITSRLEEFHHVGVGVPIRLLPFGIDEAKEFLLVRTNRRDESDSVELESLGTILESLGNLPLALEQCGAYIENTKVTFKDYAISYNKTNEHLKLLEKRKPIIGEYPDSVATTWLVNFGQVRAESRASGELLRLSAFLGGRFPKSGDCSGASVT
jgi:hypothetical protein